MYEAHFQYGYTLKNIAEYIGIHYTTASRAIKKIEREYEKWEKKIGTDTYFHRWEIYQKNRCFCFKNIFYRGVI